MSFPGENAPPSIQAAQEAIKEGRFQDAIECARALTAADSTNYDAWQVLGIAFAQTGQAAAAVDAFTQCVRQRPNIPQPHFNLAQALMSLGNRQRAREELELCLQLDPSYQKASAALRQLGDAPADQNTIGVPGIMGGPPPTPGQGTTMVQGPQIGGAPPMGMPPPAFTPGAPPPFTPGGTGLAAGQMAPPGAGYQQSFVPPPVTQTPMMLGSTRGWAISAIVLGVLYFLVAALNTLQSMSPMVQQMNPLALPMAAVNALISLCFIIGGVGVLQQRSWGRQLMVCAAGAAILMTILGGLQAINLMNSGKLQTIMNQAMTQNPNMSPQQMQQMQGIMQTSMGIGKIGMVIGLLIQLGYCIPLLLHMNSQQVKETMLS